MLSTTDSAVLHPDVLEALEVNWVFFVGGPRAATV